MNIIRKKGFFMTSGRDEMIKALKVILIPLLREKGFKGSFPIFEGD
jgi:hypothetical protein